MKWPLTGLSALVSAQSYGMSPPKLREHGGRGDREAVGTGESKGLLWDAIFWTQHGYCTHQLTVAIVTGTKLGQSTFQYRWGRESWGSTLAEEILELMAAQLQGVIFLQGLWLIVGCLCFRGWPLVHVHAGNTNCSLLLLEKKKEGEEMMA